MNLKNWKKKKKGREILFTWFSARFGCLGRGPVPRPLRPRGPSPATAARQASARPFPLRVADMWDPPVSVSFHLPFFFLRPNAAFPLHRIRSTESISNLSPFLVFSRLRAIKRNPRAISHPSHPFGAALVVSTRHREHHRLHRPPPRASRRLPVILRSRLRAG
jgi:hypothetical protein